MGLYVGHFDDDEIRLEIEGVSFSVSFSFETKEEAMVCFNEWYPYLRCKADITKMNKNVPIEASNLTNPCHKKLYRSITAASSATHREKIFNEDLVSDILVLRQAASTRRHAQNREPYKSFNFFDLPGGIPSPPGLNT